MRTVIINRSKWRTGNTYECATGKGEIAMANPQGFMCCLGFASMSFGIAPELLLGFGLPMNLPGGVQDRWPEVPKGWFDKAAKLNDGKIDRAEKETELIAHFLTIGVKLHFTGEYTEYHNI